MKFDVLQNYSEKLLLLRMPFFKEPGQVLVDVGAFRGYFSRSFAELDWQILAFEPEPENFQHCLRNLHKFPEAKCVQKAVSENSQSSIDFYISSDHPLLATISSYTSTYFC